MQCHWVILILLFHSIIAFPQGHYLEYKTHGDKDLSGEIKIFYQNGVSRTDIKLQSKEVNNALSNDLSVLFFEKQPGKVYLLNNSTKTYSEITTLDQEEWIDYDEKDYDITVNGHERVNNYNTTHVVVKVKNTSPKQDLWISKEVPSYKDFYAIKSKYTGKTNLYNAMSKKGVVGFPV
jgi:hypothetical protein